MTTKLYDRSLFDEPRHAFDFITNLLESSTEYSIIATGDDGRILLWNEGARRVYGYEPDEMIGRETTEILHTPEDRAAGKPADIARAAMRDGKWEGSLDRIRKDGERFVARVVMTPLRADGVSAGLLLISKDTSSETELKAAQYYTRSLIESNIDALMTTDPLGTITDVNRQMCEMTGLARADLIGTPFKRYFTDPQRAEDGIRRVLVEDRVVNYELTMRSADGRETTVSYNATTFRDAEGRLRGVFAAARDITDQKTLEEDLRQVQNYTRGLIEASVDALMTVDEAHLITDVNEQTARLTGYTREELIGSGFSDYFTDPGAADAGVRRTLEAGMVTNYVLVLRSKSGTDTPVSFNASVFRDTNGKVRGVFASARDITGQQRLEEELRQQQNYTRGLIESSIDPMVTVDPDFTITDVNEQMVRLTEIPKERLIGSSFPSYFTKPSRAAQGVRLTLSMGSATNYDLTLRTPSGREKLVSFNASAYKDTAGAVRGIYAIARDVTDQRRLEAELREQQNYNRGLIESSIDALMTVAPDGVITDVNEQTVRLAGDSRKQLVGSAFGTHFTDQERAAAGVAKTFTDSTVTNYELMFLTRSGQEVPVSFNAGVFRDIKGEVAGILAIARDITQQKRIEYEIREQQTYTRSLIESSIDALMTTDPLGIITDVNRQMCEVTGRSREELIGSAFKDYFTDPGRAEDGIRRVLMDTQVTNYELTIRSRDGKETLVSCNATTFPDADGRLRGVFAAARDITEQRQLEQMVRLKSEELEEQYGRLQQANQMKSQFLANMSHELRTPLNGIIGFSELMADGRAGKVTPKQERYLGHILNSSRHLLQLINDVLDLTKVESGKFDFQPEPIDPAVLLQEVADSLRSLSEKKRLRLETEIAPDLGPIVIDPGKLKQVISNYLSNALKFSPEDGQVRICVRPDGAEHFRIDVTDTGPGIEPADLDRLFVEFQQLDAGTAKQHQGTGLGLALTKRIVEAQGGRIGVVSAIGQGSTFFAVLPRLPQPVAEAARKGRQGPRGLWRRASTSRKGVVLG